LVNDSSLALWLRAEQGTSGLLGPSGVWAGSVGNAFRVSEAVPYYEPATVTVSGASATYNGIPLEVNGIYTKREIQNVKPMYTKTEPSGGELQIFWSGIWIIYWSGETDAATIFSACGPGDSLPWQNPWDVTCWSAGTITGAINPTITSTSPDCLSFEGSEYLQFANPLNGSSAELFVVAKFDDLAEGELMTGPIGNLGASQNYERWLKQSDGEGGERWRVRLATLQSNLSQANYAGFGNDGFGFQTDPTRVEEWHIYGIESGGSTYRKFANDYPSSVGFGDGYFSKDPHQITVSGAPSADGYDLNGIYDAAYDFQITLDGGARAANYVKQGSNGAVQLRFNGPWTFFVNGTPVLVKTSSNGYATNPTLVADSPWYGLSNFYGVGLINTVTLTASPSYIGKSTQGGDAYFKGRIAEILLYNRRLTDPERFIVRTYLNNKYSLWT
jgi:hypothetical protein